MSDFRTIIVMGKSVVVQDSDYAPINRDFFNKAVAAADRLTTTAVLLIEYGKLMQIWIHETGIQTFGQGRNPTAGGDEM